MTHTQSPHRVTAVPGTQHVTVRIDGTLVAETRRPLLVYETGLPVRVYITPDDVALDLLTPTETHTTCPFKGVASYWSFGGRQDVAWAYPEPLDAVAEIRDHLSFYDSAAEITVAGDVPAQP
ncbi:DUF427 domain-containing protein [Peterkaempfera sp. SMS 1(5)a]|uniref:DUF427 domain-containing protein n=1 Tax=Peterkaempfera podocarpi TaxID=3232308 RepID=UPI00366FD8B0